MHKYNGFAALLASVEELPDCGWIFVDKSIDRQSEMGLRNASYYVCVDDNEEIKLEDTKNTFLESPTFIGIKKWSTCIPKALALTSTLKQSYITCLMMTLRSCSATSCKLLGGNPEALLASRPWDPCPPLACGLIGREPQGRLASRASESREGFDSRMTVRYPISSCKHGLGWELAGRRSACLRAFDLNLLNTQLGPHMPCATSSISAFAISFKYTADNAACPLPSPSAASALR
jgi:hypothetical protein